MDNDYYTFHNAVTLFFEDRIMESLLVYEEILKDKSLPFAYIKNSLWREMAVAKMGDDSSMNRIFYFKERAKDNNFLGLVSLGCVMFLSAAVMLDKRFDRDNDFIVDVWHDLRSIGSTSHIVQASICMLYLCDGVEEPGEIPSDFMTITFPNPEIIYRYLYEHIDSFMDDEYVLADRLINERLVPMLKVKQKTRNELIASVSHLDDAPYVSGYPCDGCQAKCCLDGVYLEEYEVDMLKDFIQTYRSDFLDLPSDCTVKVKSMYEGFDDEYKTIAVPHEYSCPDFPKHFHHTKCIFVDDEDGLCRLQKVATEHQLHPYHAKPMVCWSFPMEDIRMGDLVGPPKSKEDDIYYKDEDFPGYVSCLPCCKPVENGVSWKEFNLCGIEYYNLMKAAGKLPDGDE